MYCVHCGIEMQSEDRFCRQCGWATPGAEAAAAMPTPNPNSFKRLMRSWQDRKLAGVCGGIAEYTNTDAVLIRVLLVALVIFSAGVALLAYFGAWIIMPLDRSQILRTPPPFSQPTPAGNAVG